MKRFCMLLMLGLLLPVSARAQIRLFFDIDFGSNPPPHSPGVPDSGAAILNSGVFYTAIYLSNTQPTSGMIVERSADDSFATVVQLTNLVFAAYPPPPGATAFSYEQALDLSESQLEQLLAGQWYVRIAFGNTIYQGQIMPRGPLQLLEASNLSEQQKHALLANLDAANAALVRGNSALAIKQYEIFQDKVDRLVRPDSPVLADELIAAAQSFIDLLANN